MKHCNHLFSCHSCRKLSGAPAWLFRTWIPPFLWESKPLSHGEAQERSRYGDQVLPSAGKEEKLKHPRAGENTRLQLPFLMGFPASCPLSPPSAGFTCTHHRCPQSHAMSLFSPLALHSFSHSVHERPRFSTPAPRLGCGCSQSLGFYWSSSPALANPHPLCDDPSASQPTVPLLPS